VSRVEGAFVVVPVGADGCHFELLVVGVGVEVSECELDGRGFEVGDVGVVVHFERDYVGVDYDVGVGGGWGDGVVVVVGGGGGNWGG